MPSFSVAWSELHMIRHQKHRQTKLKEINWTTPQCKTFVHQGHNQESTKTTMQWKGILQTYIRQRVKIQNIQKTVRFNNRNKNNLIQK